VKETAARSRRRPNGVDTVTRKQFQLETTPRFAARLASEALRRRGSVNSPPRFARAPPREAMRFRFPAMRKRTVIKGICATSARARVRAASKARRTRNAMRRKPRRALADRQRRAPHGERFSRFGAAEGRQFG